MPDIGPAAAPQGSLLPGRSSVEILRSAPPINLERAFEVMAREGLDGLVVLDPVNLYHLTGLWPVTSRMGFPLNAYAVLSRPAAQFTGQSLLCEDVLLDSGVTDLSVYDCLPGSELGVDLWVDSANPPGYRNP